MASDTYSSADTARILGISERRVRQLVSEGKLPADRDADKVLRIPQAAVIAERKRRKGGGRTSTLRKSSRSVSANTHGSPTLDVDAVADAVAARVGKTLESQKELTMRAESLLRDELDQARARLRETEEQLDSARARVSELEATSRSGRRRGMFRRKES